MWHKQKETNKQIKVCVTFDNFQSITELARHYTLVCVGVKYFIV